MEGERTALLRSYSNGTSRWNRNSTEAVEEEEQQQQQKEEERGDEG